MPRRPYHRRKSLKTTAAKTIQNLYRESTQCGIGTTTAENIDIVRRIIFNYGNYSRMHVDFSDEGDIELCKKEERSPLFVKKMEELKELKLNENDCIKYIKNALKSDTNKSTKQRISKKELFGYLENKQPHKCIELYTSVHGEVDGFKEDIEEFVKNKYSSDEGRKIFDKILVKYQNLRNRK